MQPCRHFHVDGALHKPCPECTLEAMSAMLGSAQDDASKLRNRIEELERRNAELLAFVDEYVEAWDDSMAGDSYLYRMANAIKAKYSAQSPSQEKGQQ